VVEKMPGYRKGQVMNFRKKTAMENELTKIRETRRAYPSGKKGNWKIKIGAKKKTTAPKAKRGRPRKRGR
jgi:hypothetical protein